MSSKGNFDAKSWNQDARWALFNMIFLISIRELTYHLMKVEKDLWLTHLTFLVNYEKMREKWIFYSQKVKYRWNIWTIYTISVLVIFRAKYREKKWKSYGSLRNELTDPFVTLNLHLRYFSRPSFDSFEKIKSRQLIFSGKVRFELIHICKKMESDWKEK